jgi:hypothetical protein
MPDDYLYRWVIFINFIIFNNYLKIYL